MTATGGNREGVQICDLGRGFPVGKYVCFICAAAGNRQRVCNGETSSQILLLEKGYDW